MLLGFCSLSQGLGTPWIREFRVLGSRDYLLGYSIKWICMKTLHHNIALRVRKNSYQKLDNENANKQGYENI